jgi:NADPH:quinone reductase-like Zn-dependent oxidoreductase
MKAAVHSRYGSPDRLALEEVTVPIPAADQLLIRIHATTVNRTDCGLLRGRPAVVRLFTGLLKPRQQVLGSEFAGEIVDIGTEVTSFTRGARVFGLEDTKLGAQAEYAVVAADGFVAEIPAGISYELAAASTDAARYAMCAIRAAQISRGQSVLVNGATGAIGTAAVQLLRHLGASVTAVCDSERAQLVTSLGADETVDFAAQDFTKLGTTFDVVFDAIGKSSLRRCARLLNPRGIYLSADPGFLAQNAVLAIVTRNSTKHRVLFPLPTTSQSDVNALTALLADGSFVPVIDRTYPLDAVVDAFNYVESGQKTGNVVIQVTPER